MEMERINRAAAAGIMLFAIVMGGFVGARADQTTIALLGGTLIGLLVAVPATAVAVAVSMRRRQERVPDVTQRYSAPMPPSPPPYWAMPPSVDPRLGYAPLPPTVPAALPQPMSAPEYLLPATRRRFYMIGDSGQVQEIESPPDAGDGYGGDAFRF
jgi:hypothetical protein